MVSVVSAVKNRASHVALWLESLAQQTLCSMMEVVLVDYSSSDDLGQVLKDSPVRVNVLKVSQREDIKGFPEAFLKNVGIRRATGDVIMATNVDVTYSKDFVEQVAMRCGSGVLVEAVRMNAYEDQEIYVDGTAEKREGQEQYSMTIDYCPENLVPLVAGADCQAMTKAYWHMFQGYDEEIMGWGSLDSDLMCRALLWGMSLQVIGHRHARYMHSWHKVDMEQNMRDVSRNHPVIMNKMNSGTVARNHADWGGYTSTEEAQ